MRPRALRTMKVFISESSNPYANAAVEEGFYKSDCGETILFFYVNSPAVVFGRSQNPWMEADISWCEENGIGILRRFSGGGTVVHDEGNLNYSFFVPREGYDPDALVGIVKDALCSLGVEARISGQRSIYAGDYKLSGSAFAVNSRTAMAHGCILVNSDLRRLSRALHIREDCEFITSTVPSVRAPVKNITDFVPGVLISDVCSAIMLQAEIDDYPQPPPAPAPEAMAQFQSFQWTYGRTPDFTFRQGATEIQVHQGIIKAPESLQGLRFEMPAAKTAAF